jgi:hypothetical protein
MTALTALAPGAALVYDAINRANNPEELHHLTCLLYRGNGEGVISDDDANFLQTCIDRRKPLGRTSPRGHLRAIGGPIGRVSGRLGSIFRPRQRPRCPDRKASRDRRRMLGGSGVLPAKLRHHYTLGQTSVLCIVAGEVKRHGICDFPIDKIAALAGVCRTTAQTAMHEAKRLGHIKSTERPQPGRKNLPNVVEIISPEWNTWIKRGPSAARIGSKTPFNTNLVSPTKTIDRKKEGATDEKRQGRGHGPPHVSRHVPACA